MLVKIMDGLFIGDKDADAAAMDRRVTHILRVGPFDDVPPPCPPGAAAPSVLVVPVDDTDDADLLDRLPPAVDFLDAAIDAFRDRRSGGAMVQCVAGVSRSVSVVCAWAMRRHGLSRDDALSRIRTRHPPACPNDGFMHQLAMWGSMGCRVDAKHPEYRRFCLEQLGVDHRDGAGVGEERLAADPGAEGASLHGSNNDDVSGSGNGSNNNNGGNSGNTNPGDLYRCRSCRRMLFGEGNVVPPSSATGWSRFKHGRGPARPPPTTASADGGAGAHSPSSLFLEPMRWMEGVLGSPRGKLYCPSCHARLGSFDWAGLQDERGQWVTPAFQVHRSKVDGGDGVGVGGVGVGVGSGVGGGVGGSKGLGGVSGVTSGGMGGVVADGVQGGTAHGVSSVGRFDFVIFDCDGVLVDSEPISCQSLVLAIHAATGVTVPGSYPDDFAAVQGMDVKGCVGHYKAQMGVEWDVEAVAAEVSRLKDGIYARLADQRGIAAIPGAASLIEALRDRGLPYALGSSGSPAKIKRNLATSGLISLFHPKQVVSASMVPRGKPHPDIYQEAMRRMGCQDPRRAMVIEDAVHGLAAARAAGAFAVGITTSAPRSVLAPHADAVIDSLAEVIQLMGWGEGEGDA